MVDQPHLRVECLTRTVGVRDAYAAICGTGLTKDICATCIAKRAGELKLATSERPSVNVQCIGGLDNENAPLLMAKQKLLQRPTNMRALLHLTVAGGEIGDFRAKMVIPFKQPVQTPGRLIDMGAVATPCGLMTIE